MTARGFPLWLASGATVSFALVAVACTNSDAPPAKEQQQPQSILFRDVAEQAGIDFRHINGATRRKYLPETMGSGGCALDFDGDGWMDVYLVQSGQLPGSGSDGPAVANRLFRNLGDGSFSDVTQAAGVGDTGYGMGAVAADYDNDGDPDIYVVNFGSDVLFRNDGDGSFSNVTDTSGIESPSWGSSAAFVDADRDGHLDLYVVNYLDFSVAKHVDCGTPSKGIYSYCHPDVYDMAADAFFGNRGDGTFRDASQSAGLLDQSGQGKGLGIVAADLDDDGWPDIYVANDSTANYLFRNRGDGSYEELGLFLGVSHNEDGMTEAGMGTDAADINGDGRMDLVVTNLGSEANALYLGGEELFDYHTRGSGLYEPSYLPLGFGVDLLDLDNDADMDLFVTNGHVIDNVELIDDVQTHRQPSQVFFNDGLGNFELLAADLAGDVSQPRVGRGTITLDYDNDGRLDVLVTYNNDRARLYRNVWPEAGTWIGLHLVGTASNRDAIGARVTVEVDAHSVTDEKKAGSSYQTSGDPRLHFGLGSAVQATRVTVRWPAGGVQVLENLEGGRYHRLVED